MTRPSRERRLGLAVASGLALAAAVTTPAGAQEEEPISGFTGASAAQQRAYEDAYTRGVSPESIGRTSRQLSRRPQLIDTPGVRRAEQISVQKLRSYGLNVSTPTYGVYASRPNEIDVTMTTPYTRRLSAKERASRGRSASTRSSTATTRTHPPVT